MKIRTDFVTNSSSSSFVICKRVLDKDQIQAIHEHVEMMEKLGLTREPDYANPWEIKESEHFISGYTWMDNLSIYRLFELIDIPDRFVDWDDTMPDLDELEDQYDRGQGNTVHSNDWRDLLHDDD